MRLLRHARHKDLALAPPVRPAGRTPETDVLIAEPR